MKKYRRAWGSYAQSMHIHRITIEVSAAQDIPAAGSFYRDALALDDRAGAQPVSPRQA